MPQDTIPYHTITYHTVPHHTQNTKYKLYKIQHTIENRTSYIPCHTYKKCNMKCNSMLNAMYHIEHNTMPYALPYSRLYNTHNIKYYTILYVPYT